jgi:hypothetical protein
VETKDELSENQQQKKFFTLPLSFSREQRTVKVTDKKIDDQ